MRFFALATAVAPLLMASTTLARSPVKRGENTDTCANLDADLVFPDVEVEGKPYVAGHLHMGLCVSRVKTFVSHYSVTEAAIKVVGAAKVEAAVIDMIKQAGVQCTYPPHARPSVTKNNVCDFVCGDGFWALPPSHASSCVCPPHLTECNGQCGQFPSDCSTTPPPSRRGVQDLTTCGVPGATSDKAFKRTDVMSDSNTCGGCVKASPFDSSPAVGVNCRDLPGVDEASCKDGKCLVHKCKGGFKISASNDACIAGSIGKSTRASQSVGIPAKAVDPNGIKIAGAVGKIPRTDATLGATSGEILSSGEADTRKVAKLPVSSTHT